MQKITLPRVAALAFCLVAFSVALDARAANGFAGRINALIEAEQLGTPKVAEPDSPAPPANPPLQIAGQPSPVATVGTTWRFQPEAMYGNGPALLFTAVNAPPWATLDATTGWLVGTPADGDVGDWGPVSIRVTDGVDSAALPEFSIVVQARHGAAGSAELSWTPPTERTDGTPLAGYRILYGTASGRYDLSADIDNPASPPSSSSISRRGAGTSPSPPSVPTRWKASRLPKSSRTKAEPPRVAALGSAGPAESSSSL